MPGLCRLTSIQTKHTDGIILRKPDRFVTNPDLFYSNCEFRSPVRMRSRAGSSSPAVYLFLSTAILIIFHQYNVIATVRPCGGYAIAEVIGGGSPDTSRGAH